MRVVAVVLVSMVAAACVESASVPCSWGSTCPAGTTCNDTLQQCVSAAQVDACDGAADFTACSYTGAPGGAFHCVGGVCIAAPRCGDGVQGDGEDCDCGDGAVELPSSCTRPNGDQADACRADCTLPACGDGVLDSAEACDDGNTTAGDGCDESCQFDGCGDGVRVAPEDCEGGDLGGETCESLGYYGGTLSCRSICRFDVSACGGRCNDATLDEPFEQCDTDQFDGASCMTLGFESGTLGCNAACRYDTTSCSGYCGDGVRGGSEECDGLDTDGVTCQDLGYAGGSLTCNPDCTQHISTCDPGVCRRFLDDMGTQIAPSDDADCGAVDCSGFYLIVGDQGPNAANKACFGRQPITDGRCEGLGDCKDANTIDCSPQPLLASPQVTCGVCQFVGGCSGTTPGTCTPYGAGTKTSLCHDCNGAGAERIAADDVACGSISCAGWYTPDVMGTGPLATERCFGHQDRRADRCTAAGACRPPNVATTCDSEPLLAAPQVTCGPCNRLVAGSCTGTTAGTCEPYPNGTQTVDTCGRGECTRPYTCQNGVNTCTPGPAAASDLPDDAFADANCDGIDGNEADAIFVAKDGSDSNPGTKASPKLTIQAAIDAASSTGKDVYVSNGTYVETLTLATNVSIYGGYDRSDNWARSNTHARIIGMTTAISGTSVSNIVLDHLAIRSASATTPGGSSYGIRLASATNVTVRQCVIEAGSGADGTTGTAGTTGDPGADGGMGGPGNCAGTSPGLPGLGCTMASNGGAGGGAGLGPSSSPTHAGAGGRPGDGPLGAKGGSGGYFDGFDQQPATGGQTAPDPKPAADGGSGNGFNTASVTAYVTSDGTSGAPGEEGSGGGGGGGGYGGSAPLICNADGTGRYGGAGGGGGGGGCGGGAGSGGSGGGGSFAIWVASSSNISIANNELVSDSGGRGGNGGAGGAGGAGGDGGPGGLFNTSGGSGAAGGAGSDGGRGGNGGGGGGGPSIGIVIRSCVSACTQSSNLITTGFPGQGGAGGSSAGATGLTTNVHVF